MAVEQEQNGSRMGVESCSTLSCNSLSCSRTRCRIVVDSSVEPITTFYC